MCENGCEHLLRLSVKPRFSPRRLDENVSAESVLNRIDVVDLSERHVDRHRLLYIVRVRQC